MAKTKHSTDERGRGWVRGTSEGRIPARPSPGKGFTLIEVLVAMGIMAMMMVSIVQLFVMATYVNKSVEQRTRLANIAQMQTEELKRTYMSLPVGVAVPPAIGTDDVTALASYNPSSDFETFLPFFQSQWAKGRAAIYVAVTVNDIRQYLPYTKDSTLPGGATLDDFLQPGSGLEAFVTWVVDGGVYTSQALEVRLDIRSGYLLSNTPFLRDVAVSYTAVFPRRQAYKLD
ncbi:MAG: prepilin-type N-terminal cleavage/methylation domain-containing protein [Acidobacteriota bacterium]|nr:MAG: prepilin-type N-terminal cleavage/methylation domain-containing protein [Acidobacteriota bacterium]